MLTRWTVCAWEASQGLVLWAEVSHFSCLVHWVLSDSAHCPQIGSVRAPEETQDVKCTTGRLCQVHHVTFWLLLWQLKHVDSNPVIIHVFCEKKKKKLLLWHYQLIKVVNTTAHHTINKGPTIPWYFFQLLPLHTEGHGQTRPGLTSAMALQTFSHSCEPR